MSGISGARSFTEKDKANALVVLAANDGNIKRTARDTTVAPATLRRWRDQQAMALVSSSAPAASPAAVSAAVTGFVDNAERVRDLALARMEVLIVEGAVTAPQLNAIVGTLTDKVNGAKGIPGQHVQHTLALPKPEDLRDLLTGFGEALFQSAQRRHDEIVDAEVVEALELPETT